MLTVESILLKKGSDVIAVLASATVRDAVAKMIEANVGCVVVEEDSEVVGIFTERDLLRRVVGGDKDPATTLISEVMSSPVQSCSPADDINHCFDLLNASSFRHLAVLDNDEAVGVISLRDVALALITRRAEFHGLARG